MVCANTLNQETKLTREAQGESQHGKLARHGMILSKTGTIDLGFLSSVRSCRIRNQNPEKENKRKCKLKAQHLLRVRSP